MFLGFRAVEYWSAFLAGGLHIAKQLSVIWAFTGKKDSACSKTQGSFGNIINAATKPAGVNRNMSIGLSKLARHKVKEP